MILFRTGYRTGWVIAALTAGLLICYTFGTAWYLVVMGGEKTLSAALWGCVIPFLPGDAVKIVLASLLSRKLRPVIQRKICA